MPLMLYNVPMKKNLVNIVMSFGLLMSVIGTPLAAHAEGIQGLGATFASDSTITTTDKKNPPIPPTTPNPSGSTSKGTETTTPPTTTDDSSGRQSRIEAEKKNMKETLTTELKTRIAERCLAAQARVKTKTTENTTATTARTKTYDEIITKLQAIVTEATANKLDVTSLQAEIIVLQTKITAFKTANATYRQDLLDLSLLDCKTDPTAFKAALTTARTDQQAVLLAAKNIRSYLIDTIKPTLQALKAKGTGTK
jgi:hypothetical protein